MFAIRWMASPWRSSGFLCSWSRSWWWWWLMYPWPAQSVSSTQTHLNRKLFLSVNGVVCDSVDPVPDFGTFDGARLLWDIPRVVTPLIGEGAGFESRSVNLGVEGLLLDEPTTAARGFSAVQQGHLIQIGVPFGAEGGYRKVQWVGPKPQTRTRFWWALILLLWADDTCYQVSSSLQSLVENNVYKEMYVIFLMYEHVFSLLYDDGSSIDTRHRMLRVLDTPLLCRPPFSFDRRWSPARPRFVDHLLVSTVLSLPQIGVHALLWAAKKLLVMSHTNVDNWYTLVSVSSVRLMATLECWPLLLIWKVKVQTLGWG